MSKIVFIKLKVKYCSELSLYYLTNSKGESII